MIVRKRSVWQTYETSGNDTTANGNVPYAVKTEYFLSGAAEECLKQLCAPEDQIYVTLWAPALVQYVAWVLEEAQKTDRKDCIFWQGMHIRCILLQRNGGIFTYSHRICYLRVSRYALRIPEYHLLGDACLDRIFLSGIDISFYQILNRAALSEEEMIAVCREINYQRSLHATLNRKEIFNLRERVKNVVRKERHICWRGFMRSQTQHMRLPLDICGRKVCLTMSVMQLLTVDG